MGNFLLVTFQTNLCTLIFLHARLLLLSIQRRVALISQATTMTLRNTIPATLPQRAAVSNVNSRPKRTLGVRTLSEGRKVFIHDERNYGENGTRPRSYAELEYKFRNAHSYFAVQYSNVRLLR